MDCRGICIQPKQQPIQIPGPGTTPTTGSPNKADRPESAFGGPMSAQNPDPKRLISDDPSGSPGDVGGQHGYDTGRKGGSCDTKGHHTAEFSSSFNESCKMAKQDQELKKNGQLSQDYLNAMGDK